MRKRTITRITLAVIAAFALMFSQVACGKDSVEKSVFNVVRAIKAARQVTTEQHEYGHITDVEYAARLRVFLAVYESADALSDELAKFNEINATNRTEVLRLLRELNARVNVLVQSGSLGVKNPKTKAKFANYALVASSTLSAIEVVIATSKKTIPVDAAKFSKLGGE